ncbi:hypothetical protein DLAC_04633 [Tieghemostelium lacteum]|uniref:DUF1997 domain-containing protein n=1 Tax=Tieghemostelium lacteum TaxID=361077 RepID=A0A151ZK80_TIELA|nr:hypothetical protein DLAC_04633 [Tieghemostelium lacteum]|eukprot:KYQ94337.1 hypothetical protein DLAC_04633 [Tieghemostelium lacteum]
MSSHTLTTILPMNADDFYRITETEHFDQFQISYLGLQSHQLKEEVDNETHIFRRVCIKPKTSIPKMLLKFANGTDELSYEDTQLKSKTKREVQFKTKAPVMAEHIHVQGVITIEPLDNETCLRVLKVTFSFTGPLQWFSSMIENNILTELKKTISLLPTIVADYKKQLAQTQTQTNNNTPSSNNTSQTTPSNDRSSFRSSNGISHQSILNKEPVAQFV